MATKQKKPAADKYHPLKGIKVLELASVLAGPSVGTFLAELGADVIKIENPVTGGDVTRKWRLKDESPNQLSSYFRSANQGKKHLFVDLASREGKDILHSLLSNMDILITNFKPGDERKFNLSDAVIRKKYPRLIAGAINGYGPDSKKLAFDICLQAESGFMSMNGTPASGPIRMPVAMIDILAAHQLKEGILVALYDRERTGKGRSLHVSLFDTALVSLAYTASNYFATGTEQILEGSLHPNIAPYGETIQMKDGKYLVLAVGTDEQFDRLSTLLKMNEAFKLKYKLNKNRVIGRKEMMDELTPKLSKLTSVTFSKKLVQTNIPFAIIHTIGESLKTKAAKRLMIHTPEGPVMRSVVFY